MVNPNTRAVSNSDTIIIQDFGDLQVLNDDIITIVHVQPLAGDMSRQPNADERSVGSNSETSRKNDFALELDDLGCITLHGLDKLLGCCDGDGFTTLATCGNADGVILCVTLDAPCRDLEIV